MSKNNPLSFIMAKFDFTEIFKGKGDLRRWSAKRTAGGLMVSYALYSMDGDITVNGLILCGIGILPLCLSFLEKD